MIAGLANGPALAVLFAEPVSPNHWTSPTIESFTWALLPATVRGFQSFPILAAREQAGEVGSLSVSEGYKAMELRGSVSLVTGGNGGLGRRICRALAEAGSSVAVVCRSSREDAEGVASELRQLDVEAEVFLADVTVREEIIALYDRVLARFGRIDILVNMEGTRMTTCLAPTQVQNALAGALLGKAADRDDVADQVVTFARTDSTTGQTVVIDAGRFFH